VLIGHEPLNRLVSEKFSIRVADKQTRKHRDTSTDNKGRLKLAVREPKIGHGLVKFLEALRYS